MNAVVQSRYGPPDVLRLTSVERPTPAADEIMVRGHASVLGPVQCAFRAGDPLLSRLFTGLRRPKHAIPGNAVAGVVAAVGDDVDSFEPGDAVFGGAWNAHAEYGCLPADSALRKPEGLSYGETAALCDGALVALPFLRETADVGPGQAVLVNGASGSVGTAAVQLATYFGADVTGVCSTAHLDLVAELGATRVFDYTAADFTDREETYDVIFDTVATRSYGECRTALAPGGVYVTTALSPSIALAMGWTALVGSRRAKFVATGLRDDDQRMSDLRFVTELAAAGELRSVVDRTYPLAESVEAHRYVEEGHKTGNVVLSLTEG